MQRRTLTYFIENRKKKLPADKMSFKYLQQLINYNINEC